jgi:hypothetical protein
MILNGCLLYAVLILLFSSMPEEAGESKFHRPDGGNGFYRL